MQISLPYLNVALWLHKPSHDTKVGKEVPRISMGGHSWNDGVVRTFAWGKNVRMRGVQGEKWTTILWSVCVWNQCTIHWVIISHIWYLHWSSLYTGFDTFSAWRPWGQNVRLSCRNHEAYPLNGLDIHGVTVGFLKLSYKMFQRLEYICPSVLNITRTCRVKPHPSGTSAVPKPM